MAGRCVLPSSPFTTQGRQGGLNYRRTTGRHTYHGHEGNNGDQWQRSKLRRHRPRARPGSVRRVRPVTRFERFRCRTQDFKGFGAARRRRHTNHGRRAISNTRDPPCFRRKHKRCFSKGNLGVRQVCNGDYAGRRQGGSSGGAFKAIPNRVSVCVVYRRGVTWMAKRVPRRVMFIPGTLSPRFSRPAIRV